MDGIGIQVSSDVDYERLIAELYYYDVRIGIMSDEPGKGLSFLILAELSTEIPLDILQTGLQRAKAELVGRKG